MTWTPEQLAEFTTAEEVVLDLHREGHDEVHVPVWMVVVDDQVFVRSYKGDASVWAKRAAADADEAVTIGGARVDVTFEPVHDLLADQISSAYLAKYEKYGASYLDPMVTQQAVAATFRLIPRM